jgi:hypothetical protein
LVALRLRWLTPTIVTLVAAALLVVAVLSAVPPLGPSLRPIDPAWPLRREDAQFFVLQAIVLFVGGLVGFVRQALRDRPRHQLAQPDQEPQLQPSTDGRGNGGTSQRAPATSDADTPTAPMLREHLR